MKKFKRGQSTLEYVIILSAVVGAVIVVAGMLKKQMSGEDGLYDKLTKKLPGAVDNFDFTPKTNP